jgi:hypothetical protein
MKLVAAHFSQPCYSSPLGPNVLASNPFGNIPTLLLGNQFSHPNKITSENLALIYIYTFRKREMYSYYCYAGYFSNRSWKVDTLHEHKLCIRTQRSEGSFFSVSCLFCEY